MFLKAERGIEKREYPDGLQKVTLFWIKKQL